MPCAPYTVDCVAVIKFNAALLAQYVIPHMPLPWFGDEGSSVLLIDPPPDETLMILGVPFDFLRTEINASTTRKGPVALVWKHCANCSAGEPDGQPMAALLTSESSLTKIHQLPRVRYATLYVCTYLPYLLSTIQAAS